MNAFGFALIGVLLGLRHAIDADHVAAVATIVNRERSFGRAAWIGALWGIGHSLSMMVVGGAMVVFRVSVPPRIGLSLELGVAVMLILLGYRNLAQGDHHHPERADVRRPLLVGIVHGLAGSAAVALLVLATIPGAWAALMYLAVFCVGTTAGMVAVTALMAAPAVLAERRMERFDRGLRLATGLLSIGFGVFLAHQIISNGLFGANPSWTPR